MLPLLLPLSFLTTGLFSTSPSSTSDAIPYKFTISDEATNYIPYDFAGFASDSDSNREKREIPDSSDIVFRRKIRAATAKKERQWPDGVVPYIISSNFSGEHKNLFLKSMRHWENHTCISFVPRTRAHKNYIVFTVDKCGCCSYVGRRGEGPQSISIGKNCDKFGIVVHELGHVVGFWHEHTRPDRDLYVDIFYKSIEFGQDYNFEKSKPGEVDSLGEPYDFASIMHYARDTFSRGIFHDTILPRPSFRHEIGQRIELSEGDIRQTKKLYNCPVCGQTFLSETAELTPTHEGYCAWRIIAPEGNTIFLNVSGQDLQLPLGPCNEEIDNSIVVHDGNGKNSKMIEKLCGDDITFKTVVSSGNRLFLEFRTSLLPNFPFAVFHTVCGGPIYEDSGVLQSPRYPDPYTPGSDCLWRIHVEAGHQVALKINFFQVEQHKDCIYDRLVIWEGAKEGVGEPLANLCGQLADKSIISRSSNVVTIRFTSDNSVQKGGFELEWQKELDECHSGTHPCEHICENTVGGFRCKCEIGFSLREDGRTCESTCGGFLHASNGSIQSPNFPQHYPPAKHCVWEIEAPDGYQIFINFTRFNVEGMKTECAYDFVRIGARSKLCGEYAEPLLFTSETNLVRLEFVSDGSVERPGFSMNFFADLDECQHQNAGCEHVCENRIGTYKCSCNPGFVLSDDGHNCKEGGCFFELNDPSGEITSPNHPNEYPKGENCTWHVLTTPGHRISLDFETFELEEHSLCTYDKLEVFDGASSSSSLLGLFCGGSVPPTTVSSSNQLFVSFVADASVSRRGFHATYQSECGGQLSAERSSGYIYSHASYSDNNYPSNSDCHWKISANNGKGVKLKFHAFHIESDAACQYDYVEVYDGPVPKEQKLFGRFCGDTMPDEIVSTGSEMLLVLHTDDSVEEKGFVAEYAEGARGRAEPSGWPRPTHITTDILNNNKHLN
ncbi:unnamed protein product, partial [Mesorhabditis spiculigera]